MQTIEKLELRQEIEIDAPIDAAFAALLYQLGPQGQMPDGKPFPMKLEAWPGGRWYRDLGNDTGHYWGQVQVIKPPTLLEICGPMFMSYAAIQHLQYRLSAEGDRTRLILVHGAIGLIPKEHIVGMEQGWAYGLKRVRDLAVMMKDRPTQFQKAAP